MRNQAKIQTPLQREKLKPRSAIYWNTISPKHAIGVRRYIHGWAWCARNGSTKTFPDSGHLTYQEALQMVTAYWDKESAVAVSYTVKQAIADYARHQRLHKGLKAEVNADRNCSRAMRPWLSREVSSITRSELTAMHASWVRGETPEKQRASKASSNRTLAACKACFNVARKSEKVSIDFWSDVEAFKKVDEARDLLLTSEEVQRVVDAADGWMAPLVRFLSETGARIGEVRDADRQDVDFDTGMISLSGKTGHRRIALRTSTIEWLDSLPVGVDGCLIPGPDGRRFKHGQHSRPFQKIVKEAAVDPSAVAYSLRHAFLSRCVSSGVSALPLSKFCGTSAAMLEKHYFHQSEAEQHAMINAVTL